MTHSNTLQTLITLENNLVTAKERMRQREHDLGVYDNLTRQGVIPTNTKELHDKERAFITTHIDKARGELAHARGEINQLLKSPEVAGPNGLNQTYPTPKDISVEVLGFGLTLSPTPDALPAHTLYTYRTFIHQFNVLPSISRSLTTQMESAKKDVTTLQHHAHAYLLHMARHTKELLLPLTPESLIKANPIQSPKHAPTPNPHLASVASAALLHTINTVTDQSLASGVDLLQPIAKHMLTKPYLRLKELQEIQRGYMTINGANSAQALINKNWINRDDYAQGPNKHGMYVSKFTDEYGVPLTTSLALATEIAYDHAQCFDEGTGQKPLSLNNPTNPTNDHKALRAWGADMGLINNPNTQTAFTVEELFKTRINMMRSVCLIAPNLLFHERAFETDEDTTYHAQVRIDCGVPSKNTSV